MRTCPYVSPDEEHRCTNLSVEPVFGSCLFHWLAFIRKDPIKAGMDVKTFLASDFPVKIRVGLSELIRRNEESSDREPHHFEGFCLPELDLRRSHFRKPVFFNNGEFLHNVVLSGAEFENDVDFSSAVFHGKLDIDSTVFRKSVSFSWTRFENDVIFSDAYILGRGGKP